MENIILAKLLVATAQLAPPAAADASQPTFILQAFIGNPNHERP